MVLGLNGERSSGQSLHKNDLLDPRIDLLHLTAGLQDWFTHHRHERILYGEGVG